MNTGPPPALPKGSPPHPDARRLPDPPPDPVVQREDPRRLEPEHDDEQPPTVAPSPDSGGAGGRHLIEDDVQEHRAVSPEARHDAIALDPERDAVELRSVSWRGLVQRTARARPGEREETTVALVEVAGISSIDCAFVAAEGGAAAAKVRAGGDVGRV